jgi:hypothetical protein
MSNPNPTPTQAPLASLPANLVGLTIGQIIWLQTIQGGRL